MTADDARLDVLIETVRSYRPHDDVDAAHRRTVLDAIERHGVAVADRATRPGHLTGSALVVDSSRSRLVLLHHAKLDIWVQPGGHADGELDLAAVAVREATEETGIDGLIVRPEIVDIDVHEVRPPREDSHLHLDLRYLVIAPPDAELHLNHESRAGEWLSPDQALRRNSESGMQRLVTAGFG